MANEEKILEMLGTINDRLGRLEAAQDKMQAAQDKMQEDLDTVKAAQDKMQSAQDKMQEDITRINVTLEVKIAKEIQLLADGHMGIVEKLKKLDELEEKLENVSIKVDAIHAVVMEHSRDITELKRVR